MHEKYQRLYEVGHIVGYNHIFSERMWSPGWLLSERMWSYGWLLINGNCHKVGHLLTGLVARLVHFKFKGGWSCSW